MLKRDINKKGSIQDIVFVGMVLLVLGITTLFGFLFMSNINDHFQANTAVTTDGKTASATLTGFFPGVIDNSFLLLAIGMGIVALIMAALVRVHPIFIPIFLIALIFVVFFSGVFSNIYQEMANHSQMLAYSSQLTFINTVLTYLPIITAVFGILLMMVMYKLWSVDQ